MMFKNSNWKHVLIIVIGLSLFLQFSAQTETTNTVQICEEIMENLQQILEEEPELPDEIYTGIMFIKMDAVEYLENEEYQKCLEKLEIIARLLNVDENVDYQFPADLIDNGAENDEI